MTLDKIRNIYLLGDLHLGVRNNSIEWFEIQKSFILNWFIPAIIKDGFDPEKDILFQAGDWNHVRESTNVRISNGSLEIFKTLSDTFKNGIHIILGNHDVYYKDRNDVHSLKETGSIFNNIKIYESPEKIKIGGHNILMLPWEHDSDKLSQTVESYSDSCDYIICHADIKDFKLNKWAKVEHGIDVSKLSKYKKIYSGHIHTRQENKNVVYVGTPYHLDRGDVDNTKGFYKLNLEGENIKEYFYENTFSPKYVKYDIEEILNLSANEIKDRFKNNFVDISISNDLAKTFPLTKFLDILKDGHRSLEFRPYSKDKDFNIDEIKSTDTYEYNIYEVLSDYIDIREIPKSLSSKIMTKFKQIHTELKNNQKYYE